MNREDTVVRALRTYLRSHLDASLAGAAAELAVSTRTLQRRLLDAASSFRSELQAARIERAQHLLANTDDKVTSIALEVCCASVQQFSDLFRRATNTTPTEWRQQRRRAGFPSA